MLVRFVLAASLATLAGCTLSNNNDVCVSPLIKCGALCVNLANDTGNCGRCENACNPGLVCSAGSCACPAGQRLCGSSCQSIFDDPKNCGACGVSCAAGVACVAGACATPSVTPQSQPITCTSGQLECGGACVDSNTDSNCGSCGNTCDGGRSCQSGSCQCTHGDIFCGGSCTSSTSNSNCGGCNNVCDGGRSCNGSSCACPGGQIFCDGACVDGASNSNCGVCGKTCDGGSTCGGPANAKTCGCPSGQILCGNVCVDSGTNTNCGVCGKTCDGGTTCQGATNAKTCECPTGQSVCDGACVTTTNDDLHCGGCNACPGTTGPTGGQGCAGSVCAVRGVAPSAPVTAEEQPFALNGTPQFTFSGTLAASQKFECRSLPKGAVATTPFNAGWSSCDGASGTGTTHAAAFATEGTHVTQVRKSRGGNTPASTIATSSEYYVHQSLNGVAQCSFALTHAQIFKAAADRFAALPTALDSTDNSNAEYYPSPAGLTTLTPPFDVAGSDLTPPFVNITFAPVRPSMQYAFGTLGAPKNSGAIPGAAFAFTLSSSQFAPLRHRLSFNPANVPSGVAAGSLLLIERSRPSRVGGNGCTMPVDLVNVLTDFVEVTPGTWAFQRKNPGFNARGLTCRAIVVKSDGSGFCFTNDAVPLTGQYSRYMWRKLFKGSHTSPKCSALPCAPHELYLPD